MFVLFVFRFRTYVFMQCVSYHIAIVIGWNCMEKVQCVRVCVYMCTQCYLDRENCVNVCDGRNGYGKLNKTTEKKEGEITTAIVIEFSIVLYSFMSTYINNDICHPSEIKILNTKEITTATAKQTHTKSNYAHATRMYSFHLGREVKKKQQPQSRYHF